MADAPPTGGHHSKRRVYPQQQYTFSQPAAPGAVPGADYGAPGLNNVNALNNQAPNTGGNPMAPGQVFTPGAPMAGAPVAGSYFANQQQTADQQLSGQFGQMNLGGVDSQRQQQPSPYGQQVPQQQQQPTGKGGVPLNGYGVPSGGPGAAGQFGRLPLNQLYNIDLLQSMPLPVSDLDLPPPPIIVAPEAAALGNVENAQSASKYARCTLNVVPNSPSLFKKSKLPFALIVRPFAALDDADDELPTVTDSIISRCRRCRSYINPFIRFTDQQHRWQCSICGLMNEIPTSFDWDEVNSQAKNRYSRAELNYGANEFLAPTAYLVRAPQPPVYVFVLDCSIAAIQSGLLATAARTILENLDRIPNKDGRTRVGFIAVDSALHFFKLPEATANANAANGEDGENENGENGANGDPADPPEISMLVVSDLEDPFLPSPVDLLVNLNERRASVELLLESIGDMFANNVNSNHALGPALKAAHKLIGSIGGKIITLTASLPNMGIGKLDVREDRKLLGSSKEGSLLQAANSFYKSFAVECNRSQVSLDMFLFSATYQDVASLSNLPRYTAGQTYFYPGWSASRPTDAIKFASEFGKHLSMDFAMEAVLRLRASTGLRLVGFYGNFFSRSSDLCSLPTAPRDQSYVIELGIDDTITAPYVYFQVAVLHTTNKGDRRIRTLNLALPTSGLLQDVYASADQLAITNYFTRRAVEKAMSSNNGINEAHEYLTSKLQDMLATYKKELMTTNIGASSPLQFSANLRMLPLLINALMKHVGLRKSEQIPSDLRSAALCLLSTLPLSYLIKYIHPDFYSLHDMPEDAGYPSKEEDKHGEIVLPPKMNLTGVRMESHGLYLIDDGQIQFLWIGRDAVPQLLLDAFGVPTMQQITSGKTDIPEVDSELNRRIRNIVGKSRERTDSITYPALYIVKEDSDRSLKTWASTFLIEDRSDKIVSYYEFVNSLRNKLTT